MRVEVPSGNRPKPCWRSYAGVPTTGGFGDLPGATTHAKRGVQLGAYAPCPALFVPPTEMIVTAVNEQATTSTSSRLWTFWVTSTNDDEDGRTDHAVPEEELAAGSGRYAAVCGAVVHPASLTTPPGWQCERCVMLLRARAQRPGRHGHGPAARRSGWLARVLEWGRD